MDENSLNLPYVLFSSSILPVSNALLFLFHSWDRKSLTTPNLNMGNDGENRLRCSHWTHIKECIFRSYFLDFGFCFKEGNMRNYVINMWFDFIIREKKGMSLDLVSNIPVSMSISKQSAATVLAMSGSHFGW